MNIYRNGTHIQVEHNGYTYHPIWSYTRERMGYGETPSGGAGRR